MGDPWKSISPEGVRAFTYGVLSTLLIWLWAEDYLLIVNDLLITVGTPILLAKSIVISTVISLLVILILYGLHGKLPTTLMLQHMTWVKNPDKFFFVYANTVATIDFVKKGIYSGLILKCKFNIVLY